MITSRAVLGFGLVTLSLLTTSCTLKPKSDGTLTLLFKAPEKMMDSLLSGDPTALFEQLSHPQSFATPPSTASGFACYGVNVVGPGIANSSSNPKPLPDLGPLLRRETTCAYKGITAGPVYPGAGTVALTAHVPSGNDRLVQVVGINNAAYCASNFLDGEIEGSDPEAYELGRARVNVFNDMSLTIANDYTSANSATRRVDCGGASSGCSALASASTIQDTGIFIDNANFGFQPFPAVSGDKISQVTVRLGRSASAQNVTLSIHASTPGGTMVGTSQTLAIPANSDQDLVFQWPQGSEPTIAASGTYWIKVAPNTSSPLKWFAGGLPPAATAPNYGPVGNPRVITSVNPSVVSQVEAGAVNTCIIGASGDVRCAGFYGYGALGETEYSSTNKPVFGNAASMGITPNQIAVGYDHACAYDSAGAVRCWGSNSANQLGGGTPGVDSNVPLGNGPTGVARLSAGRMFSCAVKTDNSAACWGAGSSFQLGNNSSSNSLSPVTPVGLTASTVVDVSAGASHACAVKSDNTLVCWGSNSQGELGDNSLTNRQVPTAVSGGITNATKVAAGDAFTCALLSDGSVTCWGDNNYGQLGDGTTTDSIVPVVVNLGGSTATAIDVGSNFACALLSDSQVKCWGANTVGQIGIGTTTSSEPTPQFVKNPTGTGPLINVSTLSIGVSGIHACAKIGSDPVCWGDNSVKQLAIGLFTAPTYQTLPTPSSFLKALAFKVESCL